MKTRAILFGVFLPAGLLFGFFSLRLVMSGVWGAPTHPVQYIALVSSLGLFLCSFLILTTPVKGRALATLCILGMGALYVPASASLIPAPSTLISPLSYLIVIGYFALLAFALCYPVRWRASIPVLVALFMTSVAFAVTTYVHRAQHGDMQWPSIVHFNWLPGATGLQVQRDTSGAITPAVKELLLQHGITGELSWSGTQGNATSEPRLIVICRSRIPAPMDLHYPRHGTVIYVFDGTAWKSIPDRPDLYPAHATLTTEGMLEQDYPDGGRQGSLAFVWH